MAFQIAETLRHERVTGPNLKTDSREMLCVKHLMGDFPVR
jgi:hypothetical protein